MTGTAHSWLALPLTLVLLGVWLLATLDRVAWAVVAARTSGGGSRRRCATRSGSC